MVVNLYLGVDAQGCGNQVPVLAYPFGLRVHSSEDGVCPSEFYVGQTAIASRPISVKSLSRTPTGYLIRANGHRWHRQVLLAKASHLRAAAPQSHRDFPVGDRTGTKA